MICRSFVDHLYTYPRCAFYLDCDFIFDNLWVILQIIQCTTVFKVGIWCFADQLYIHGISEMCMLLIFWLFGSLWGKKPAVKLGHFLYNIEYSLTPFLWIGRIYQFRVTNYGYSSYNKFFLKIRFDVTLTAFLLFTWVTSI